MHRGEIRWYTFKEPGKKRPVLLLTRDSAIPYLNEVTIAPLTTNIRDIPSECLLTRQDGIPTDSAVNLDHIQTVSKRKLGNVIARLNSIKLREVEIALCFALGFD